MANPKWSSEAQVVVSGIRERRPGDTQLGHGVILQVVEDRKEGDESDVLNPSALTVTLATVPTRRREKWRPSFGLPLSRRRYGELPCGQGCWSWDREPSTGRAPTQEHVPAPMGLCWEWTMTRDLSPAVLWEVEEVWGLKIRPHACTRPHPLSC